MKKLTIVLAIAFCGFAFTLGSCKKCSTCSFNDGGQQYTYPEKGGKSSDIDAYKQGGATAAALIGTTCTCTSK